MNLSKSQLNVLRLIYSATDCSNEVFDYATLHWTQQRIADGLRGLVQTKDGVVSVDGDGFVLEPERHGRGFRLTTRGYEALTNHDSDRYPANLRRFVQKEKPHARR